MRGFHGGRCDAPRHNAATGRGIGAGRGTGHGRMVTLDITPAMRARIKVSAFTQGVTVADLLRALLEREFPEEKP
ncbi:hypothetical protein CBP34_13085 [Acidovorax carolinensis]|uniref:Chromosome partitioning protein ParB n=1 Tax=Acidovorax carolinensis TaxID=553814 RepID=A0A240U4S7_9BURK|nr:hypothetical protein CBP34_13085 [Acidovorax carolinensis]